MNKIWCCVWLMCLGEMAINTHGFGVLPSNRIKVDVYNFKNCPEEKDLTIQFVDPVFYKDPETDTLYVSGTFIMNVTVDYNTISLVTIKKCSDKSDRSCLKYLNYQIEPICDILWQKNKPAYEFTKRAEGMEENCPIKPGVYKIEDAPLMTNGSLPSTNIVQGHWRIQYSATINGKIAACTITSVEIKLDRKQKSK